MYDKHHRKDILHHFEPRDLETYSAAPLLLEHVSKFVIQGENCVTLRQDIILPIAPAFFLILPDPLRRRQKLLFRH